MTHDPAQSPNHAIDDEATRIAPASNNTVNTGKPTSDFEHLTILDVIGQGGVGRVYLAYDETIGRRVAVKELLEELGTSETANDEIGNSFVHEAKVTGKLEHPGVVPVYTLGRRSDGRPYYVMRHIKGETLEQKLRKTTYSDAQQGYNSRLPLLDVLIDACNTIAYAHAKGVIHRDLKPSNIICGNFGETIVVDWGLAQVLDDNDNTYFYREALTHQRHTLSDTSTSEVLGTPAYMAPEQFTGIAGKSSDVYSLGIILFRIITGTQPYRGTLSEIQQMIETREETPSPKQLNPFAAPELIAICEKAIHKQPSQRFNDAGELVEQLKAFRDGRLVNIYAYSKRELFKRFLAQNKFIVLLSALLMLTIIAGAAFSVHYATRMKQAKLEAENALELVTTYGESSQQQARVIAQTLKSQIARLFEVMTQSAAQLATHEQEETSILAELQTAFPHIESFSVKKIADLPTIFNLSDIASGKPDIGIDNDQLVVFFRVAIGNSEGTGNYLEAKIAPQNLFPSAFPKLLKQESHPRDIWMMRSDGLILYDANAQYIGTNLFTDRESNRSASLQAFGRLTLVDDDSIGYYSFIDNDTEYFKIAAWNSIEFGPKESWKIIVNYTYTRKDLD